MSTQVWICLGLALDVIAKCAFGIETNASENPDHEFVKAGTEIAKLMQEGTTTFW